MQPPPRTAAQPSPQVETSGPFAPPWLRWGLVAAFLLPLVIYAFNGQYTRLLADDYCFVARVRDDGLWGSLVWYHYNWQATFATSLIQGIVGSLGVGAARVLPALLLGGLWAALVWLLHEVCLWLRLRRPAFVALLLGSASTYSVLDALPNLIQGLYWTSGAASYVTPTIFITLFLALLLRVARLHAPGSTDWRGFIAGVLLMGFTAGFGANIATLQIGLFGLLGLLVWFFAPAQRRVVLPLLASALLATALVLLFQTFAPGTAVRMARQPEALPLAQVLTDTLVYSFSFIAAGIGLFGLAASIGVFLLAGVLGYTQLAEPSAFIRRRWRWLLLLSFVMLYLLIVATTGPIVYATTEGLPARAFTPPQLATTLTVALWGFVMGANLRSSSATPRLSPLLWALIAVLLAAGPLLSSVQALGDTLPQMRSFASEWDARNAALLEQVAQGERNPVVAPFSVVLELQAWIEPPGTDPRRGQNICAARYYQVESFTVAER